MTFVHIAFIAALATGAEPDELSRKFGAMTDSKTAKNNRVSGRSAVCLGIALADFTTRLKADSILLKYGREVEDFDILLVDERSLCIVSFNARRERGLLGGGYEYWIDGKQIMGKGYSK